MMRKETARVLHILGELKYSGAEIMLSSGAEELGAAGSMIVSTGLDIGDYASELKASGYEITHLPFLRSFRFFKGLSDIIRRERPDVVHVHTERASILLALVAILNGVRVVRTIHNEFLFTGTLRIKRIIDRNIARFIGVRFVSCSSRVQRNEKDRFFLKTEKINNWIEFNRIKDLLFLDKAAIRARIGLPSDAYVTISIANEAPAKNLMAIFEALGRIEQRHFHIHVGEASEHLQSGADYFCPSQVIFTGVQAEIAPFLKASDAFVCSSTFEGGPLVLMEAAASGLPCVTTNVGVAEEFFGLPGIIPVDPSSTSIADGIRKAAAMPAEIVHTAASSLYDFTRSRFKPEIGAHLYSQIYQSLC